MKTLFMFPGIAATAILLLGCSSDDAMNEEISALEEEVQTSPIVSVPSTPAQPDLGAALPSSPSGVRTADLEVPAEFNFDTSWDMHINFELPTANSFLSICTKFSKNDLGMPDVDFSSCIVRAPITDGTYQANAVPMSNQIEALMAVVVDYSNPENPLFVEFPITTGQTELTWDLGIQL